MANKLCFKTYLRQNPSGSSRATLQTADQVVVAEQIEYFTAQLYCPILNWGLTTALRSGETVMAYPLYLSA